MFRRRRCAARLLKSGKVHRRASVMQLLGMTTKPACNEMKLVEIMHGNVCACRIGSVVNT